MTNGNWTEDDWARASTPPTDPSKETRDSGKPRIDGSQEAPRDDSRDGDPYNEAPRKEESTIDDGRMYFLVTLGLMFVGMMLITTSFAILPLLGAFVTLWMSMNRETTGFPSTILLLWALLGNIALIVVWGIGAIMRGLMTAFG